MPSRLLVLTRLAPLLSLALFAARCDGPGGGAAPIYVADGSASDLLNASDDGAGTSDVPGDANLNLPDGAVGSPDVPLGDVNVAPPDVALSKQPLGGVCFFDDDCADGWCNTSYPGGYCSKACTSHDECPDGGKCYPDPNGAAAAKMCWKACTLDGQCRTDQFCPSGAKICTPRCEVGGCSSGYVCDEASGECVPATSIPCEPSPEVCDGVDNSCDHIVDEGCGPALAERSTWLVADLGRVTVGGGGLSKKLTVKVSPAAGSFEILVISTDDSPEYMALFDLTSPSGEKLVVGTDPYNAPIRAMPGVGVATILVSNTPAVPVEGGTYSFTVYREGDKGEAWVYVIQNIRKNQTQSVLDMNLWFVGTPGLTSTTAPTSTTFQALLDEATTILGYHGISVGQVHYYDVTGAAAQKYTIVDTGGSLGVDEHAELVKLSEQLPAANKGVNFFFVQGFTGWGLLGKAGGIPGPPMHGTWSSGVVVSLADLYSYDLDYAVSLTAHAMVHELLHQLGLYHTTEQDGSMYDPIPDTPECPKSYDTNGDGLLDGTECLSKDGKNIMFWTAHGYSQLSDGQRFVVHGNPSLGQ